MSVLKTASQRQQLWRGLLHEGVATEQGITFCLCKILAGFCPSHTVYVIDLLEVECQICCYNGNFHQVNHVLMLSAVEVLTYIQRLKSKGKGDAKSSHGGVVHYWPSPFFKCAHFLIFLIASASSSKVLELWAPFTACWCWVFFFCSLNGVSVLKLVTQHMFKPYPCPPCEFARNEKIAGGVCQPWPCHSGYRRTILYLAYSNRDNDTASEETE